MRCFRRARSADRREREHAVGQQLNQHPAGSDHDEWAQLRLGHDAQRQVRSAAGTLWQTSTHGPRRGQVLVRGSVRAPQAQAQPG